jgi:hypothetical protein
MTTETTTEFDPSEAPSGTLFSYNEPNGRGEHICTIEGWNIEDGEYEYILRFLSPWTTEHGTTIFPFYEGVPAHRLSFPSDGAIFDEMEKAEQSIDALRDKMDRVMEDLAAEKAVLAKLTAIWVED